MRTLFLSRLVFGLLCATTAATAQKATPIPRIVVLHNASAVAAGPLLGAFRAGMAQLGYIEGQNVVIDARFLDGKPEGVDEVARELLTLAPDVVVTAGPQSLLAFKRATTIVPIVMAIIADPVELGLVASLARPGTNLTGLAFQNQALTVKRLELLKEIVPKASRVAVLSDSNFGEISGYKQAEVAARTLQLQLHSIPVRRTADFEAAFVSATKGHADALLVLASPFLNPNRQTVVELAAREHLPASYEAKTFVDAGGLMSYGPNFPDMYRRSATYVDKILKGAKPADLPIEQPTKFELAINVKTAKALGLKLPSSILLRADQIVE
jgi:putative ABC transport system substrate-binding protein